MFLFTSWHTDEPPPLHGPPAHLQLYNMHVSYMHSCKSMPAHPPSTGCQKRERPPAPMWHQPTHPMKNPHPPTTTTTSTSTHTHNLLWSQHSHPGLHTALGGSSLPPAGFVAKMTHLFTHSASPYSPLSWPFCMHYLWGVKREQAYSYLTATADGRAGLARLTVERRLCV